MIALGLQGSISPGWVSDGQSDRALSCPVVGYWTPNPADTRTAQQFVYPSEVDSEGPSYYQLSANISEPLRCVEIGQPGSLFFVPPAFLTASAGSVFTLEDGIVYPRSFSEDNSAFDIRAVEGSVTVLTNEDGRITGEYTFETQDVLSPPPEEGQTETVSGTFDAIVCD